MNRNDWILMFGLKVAGKAHATLKYDERSSERPESWFELAPKSWTLIKAYSGALCKLGSVCDRTQLFQF